MFNINYKKYTDEFIKNNNITSNIEYVVDKLSYENNLSEFLNNIFEKATSNSFIILIDAVVFHDDAYINTIYSSINNEFKRIYQVNEILNITNKYASLEYFIKFKDMVSIENIDNSLINDIPENIKADMLIMDNGTLKKINQNFAVYIFKKY